jgi:hypothetical protein
VHHDDDPLSPFTWKVFLWLDVSVLGTHEREANEQGLSNKATARRNPMAPVQPLIRAKRSWSGLMNGERTMALGERDNGCNHRCTICVYLAQRILLRQRQEKTSDTTYNKLTIGYRLA